MPDQNQDAGASAWSGKPLSATPKDSIRKDLPDPAKNTKPEPPVPVDTYYKKYNEMMARANGGSVQEGGEPKIASQATPEPEEEDQHQKQLRELIESGHGLYISEVPVDFVLSDRAFRTTGIKAKNGKPIFEVIYQGRAIGLAVRDAERML